jgi:hypothetical protein
MSVILESGGTKSSLVSGLHALGSWAEALARGDKLSARIPARSARQHSPPSPASPRRDA